VNANLICTSVVCWGLWGACASPGKSTPPGPSPLPVGVNAVPINCPDWGCGSNAASMGALLPFHEADATHRFANSAGLCFWKLLSPDEKTEWNLEVDGHHMRAIDPTDKTVKREGPTLVGFVLYFYQQPAASPHDQTGERCQRPKSPSPANAFKVWITDALPINFWVKPECSECFWSYVFRWQRFNAQIPDGGKKALPSLCKEGGGIDPLPPEWNAGAPSWGSLAGVMALVFQGDRYDAKAKTVFQTGPAVEGWFNIACAGTAVAKMHLLRHTQAGESNTGQCQLSTSPDERQAMLKMITADVCGGGHSFTHDGKDVRYMDRNHFRSFDLAKDPSPYPSLPGSSSLEGVWTSKGAACLSTPRLADEWKPALPPAPPTLAADIQAECTKAGVPVPPACEQVLGKKLVPSNRPGDHRVVVVTWPNVGYGISAINGTGSPHDVDPSWPACAAVAPPR
jgi:hypothetical protein